MLLAERSFGNTISGSIPYPDTTTTAHDARTMRWCQGADGNWGLDIQFLVGSYANTDSAGGIGYEGIADKVWMLADALSVPPNPWIYGLQGMPATGAPPSGSIWVDIDNNFATYQKWQQGSIDVTCLAESGCEFETIDIDCKPTPDGTFDFLWTVSITNNSPYTADILILPDPAFAPNNVILLASPIAPGDKVVLDIPISGGKPGEEFCFTATLGSIKGDECCTEEICIVLPDCDCFEYDEVVSDLPGNGSFTVSLAMTNLEPFVAEWVTLAVSPAGAGTVTPSIVNIPSTPQYGSVTAGPVTVTTTAAPGSTITLVVGLHAQTFHPCCFIEIPIVVPANAGSEVPGDIDGDGVVNATDLAIVFNNWGGAGATDVNGDGVTDGADLSILLANWG